MRRGTIESRFAKAIGHAALCIPLLCQFAPARVAASDSPRSKTIYSVLREPLPPEEIRLVEGASEFRIVGPTFTYRIRKSTGAITGVRVERDGKEVISGTAPAEVSIDGCRLSSPENACRVSLVSSGKDKVVIEARGKMGDPARAYPEVSYSSVHTFFNDGVVVSNVKLLPSADLHVQKEIAHELRARGQFSHYLHKRRDEHGQEAARGQLPRPGKAIGFDTLTSCLGVFSPATELAIFTDGGAIHLSRANLQTAAVEALRESRDGPELALKQYIVRIAAGDQPFVLKAGEEFAFRTGISVAPNRLPHPRTHDLRMFIWIGDAKFPYPTDGEIEQVARWGYTAFQMHRVGALGEPRPPAGELERVIRKVHECGMLFVWLELADLIYANVPAAQELRAKGEWARWQGFNYGGRYTDFMDPYCDLAATCLASPNGLKEHRLEAMDRMMDRYDVDGIYLDDNLAYPNCTLQSEHGHPRKTYDCLIELHEMNWRRRQLLRARNPHALLICHCTKAFVLPVIADFDALLYGEGYSFDSVQDYWSNYTAHREALRAQGMLYAGGRDAVRCPAAMAYNYDLLSGGGQYCQIDWRLFREKFPYAAGVQEAERAYVEAYNPAQFYFGLYESEPHYFANSKAQFATTSSNTHATIYRNRMWNDLLIAIANLSPKAVTTSLTISSLKSFGLSARKDYLLFDVHRRTTRAVAGGSVGAALENVVVRGENLELFTLRASEARPMHVWGGKRIAENWHPKRRVLSVELHGPPGLRDTVFLSPGRRSIAKVTVSGQDVPFYFDPTQGLVHGEITFTHDPVKLEVHCASTAGNGLPERQVVPGALISKGLLTDN